MNLCTKRCVALPVAFFVNPVGATPTSLYPLVANRELTCKACAFLALLIKRGGSTDHFLVNGTDPVIIRKVTERPTLQDEETFRFVMVG